MLWCDLVTKNLPVPLLKMHQYREYDLNYIKQPEVCRLWATFWWTSLAFAWKSWNHWPPIGTFTQRWQNLKRTLLYYFIFFLPPPHSSAIRFDIARNPLMQISCSWWCPSFEKPSLLVFGLWVPHKNCASCCQQLRNWPPADPSSVNSR